MSYVLINYTTNCIIYLPSFLEYEYCSVKATVFIKKKSVHNRRRPIRIVRTLCGYIRLKQLQLIQIKLNCMRLYFMAGTSTQSYKKYLSKKIDQIRSTSLMEYRQISLQKRLLLDNSKKKSISIFFFLHPKKLSSMYIVRCKQFSRRLIHT